MTCGPILKRFGWLVTMKWGGTGFAKGWVSDLINTPIGRVCATGCYAHPSTGIKH